MLGRKGTEEAGLLGALRVPACLPTNLQLGCPLSITSCGRGH